MSAHFAVQSIVKRESELTPQKQESSVLYPDMTKFHPGGDGAGQGRAARQADYMEGFEAGKAEAAQMYEQTIRVMENALDGLKSSMAQMKQDVESSHGEVLKHCLHALLPELAQDIFRQEMQSVITEATKSQVNPNLTVKLHPENDVAKSFLQKGFDGTLYFVEREEMESSAVHFSWGDSATEINPIKTAQTCLDLLGIASGTERKFEQTLTSSCSQEESDFKSSEEMREAS